MMTGRTVSSFVRIRRSWRGRSSSLMNNIVVTIGLIVLLLLQEQHFTAGFTTTTLLPKMRPTPPPFQIRYDIGHHTHGGRQQQEQTTTKFQQERSPVGGVVVTAAAAAASNSNYDDGYYSSPSSKTANDDDDDSSFWLDLDNFGDVLNDLAVGMGVLIYLESQLFNEKQYYYRELPEHLLQLTPSLSSSSSSDKLSLATALSAVSLVSLAQSLPVEVNDSVFAKGPGITYSGVTLVTTWITHIVEEQQQQFYQQRRGGGGGSAGGSAGDSSVGDSSSTPALIAEKQQPPPPQSQRQFQQSSPPAGAPQMRRKTADYYDYEQENSGGGAPPTAQSTSGMRFVDDLVQAGSGPSSTIADPSGTFLAGPPLVKEDQQGENVMADDDGKDSGGSSQEKGDDVKGPSNDLKDSYAMSSWYPGMPAMGERIVLDDDDTTNDDRGGGAGAAAAAAAPPPPPKDSRDEKIFADRRPDDDDDALNAKKDITTAAPMIPPPPADTSAPPMTPPGIPGPAATAKSTKEEKKSFGMSSWSPGKKAPEEEAGTSLDTGSSILPGDITSGTSPVAPLGIPGSSIPGSSIPGSSIPGSSIPGSSIPASPASKSTKEKKSFGMSSWSPGKKDASNISSVDTSAPSSVAPPSIPGSGIPGSSIPGPSAAKSTKEKKTFGMSSWSPGKKAPQEDSYLSGMKSDTPVSASPPSEASGTVPGADRPAYKPFVSSAETPRQSDSDTKTSPVKIGTPSGKADIKNTADDTGEGDLPDALVSAPFVALTPIPPADPFVDKPGITLAGVSVVVAALANSVEKKTPFLEGEYDGLIRELQRTLGLQESKEGRQGLQAGFEDDSLRSQQQKQTRNFDQDTETQPGEPMDYDPIRSKQKNMPSEDALPSPTLDRSFPAESLPEEEATFRPGYRNSASTTIPDALSSPGSGHASPSGATSAPTADDFPVPPFSTTAGVAGESERSPEMKSVSERNTGGTQNDFSGFSPSRESPSSLIGGPQPSSSDMRRSGDAGSYESDDFSSDLSYGSSEGKFASRSDGAPDFPAPPSMRTGRLPSEGMEQPSGTTGWSPEMAATEGYSNDLPGARDDPGLAAGGSWNDESTMASSTDGYDEFSGPRDDRGFAGSGSWYEQEDVAPPTEGYADLSGSRDDRSFAAGGSWYEQPPMTSREGYSDLPGSSDGTSLASGESWFEQQERKKQEEADAWFEEQVRIAKLERLEEERLRREEFGLDFDDIDSAIAEQIQPDRRGDQDVPLSPSSFGTPVPGLDRSMSSTGGEMKSDATRLSRSSPGTDDRVGDSAFHPSFAEEIESTPPQPDDSTGVVPETPSAPISPSSKSGMESSRKTSWSPSKNVAESNAPASTSAKKSDGNKVDDSKFPSNSSNFESSSSSTVFPEPTPKTPTASESPVVGASFPSAEITKNSGDITAAPNSFPQASNEVRDLSKSLSSSTSGRDYSDGISGIAADDAATSSSVSPDPTGIGSPTSLGVPGPSTSQGTKKSYGMSSWSPTKKAPENSQTSLGTTSSIPSADTSASSPAATTPSIPGSSIPGPSVGAAESVQAKKSYGMSSWSPGKKAPEDTQTSSDTASSIPSADTSVPSSVTLPSIPGSSIPGPSAAAAAADSVKEKKSFGMSSWSPGKKATEDSQTSSDTATSIPPENTSAASPVAPPSIPGSSIPGSSIPGPSAMAAESVKEKKSFGMSSWSPAKKATEDTQTASDTAPSVRPEDTSVPSSVTPPSIPGSGIPGSSIPGSSIPGPAAAVAGESVKAKKSFGMSSWSPGKKAPENTQTSSSDTVPSITPGDTSAPPGIPGSSIPGSSIPGSAAAVAGKSTKEKKSYGMSSWSPGKKAPEEDLSASPITPGSSGSSTSQASSTSSSTDDEAAVLSVSPPSNRAQDGQRSRTSSSSTAGRDRSDRMSQSSSDKRGTKADVAVSSAAAAASESASTRYSSDDSAGIGTPTPPKAPGLATSQGSKKSHGASSWSPKKKPTAAPAPPLDNVPITPASSGPTSESVESDDNPVSMLDFSAAKSGPSTARSISLSSTSKSVSVPSSKGPSQSSTDSGVAVPTDGSPAPGVAPAPASNVAPVSPPAAGPPTYSTEGPTKLNRATESSTFLTPSSGSSVPVGSAASASKGARKRFAVAKSPGGAKDESNSGQSSVKKQMMNVMSNLNSFVGSVRAARDEMASQEGSESSFPLTIADYLSSRADIANAGFKGGSEKSPNNQKRKRSSGEDQDKPNDEGRDRNPFNMFRGKPKKD